MPRAEKEAKVREIAGELEGAEAAVLAGYRGLTVEEAAELRGSLIEVGTRFAVVKNSLAMLAVKEAGLEELTEFFDGPTAVAFVKGDPVAATKRLVEQSKKFPVLEIRGGFAEGRVLSAEQIQALAALDSREVMLARIAGLGKMQMAKAAWMFQALQTKFLLLLQALKEKLPAEEGAEATATEDHPDAEQPGGGEDTGGEEPVEGPDQPEPEETQTEAETQTEPESPGGPPSEETQTEGTEEGGE